MSDPFDNQKADVNVVVPAWGDDFDLTKFFRELEPSRFSFRDSRDLASAADLFKLVQRLILRWAALYRAVVQAANAHPEAVARAVKCVRRMGTIDWNAYRSWFTTPDTDFDGMSPRDWFVRNNLEEFAALLGGEQSASTTSPIVVFGSACGREQTSGSGNQIPDLCPGEPSQITADMVRTVMAGLQNYAQLEVEPAFDLRPLLARCSPQNQSFVSTSDKLLASEVFVILETESLGWLRLYSVALSIGRERGGILPKIVLCIQKLLLMGFRCYLDWFRSRQEEFGGRSPESFFVDEGLVILVFLLGGAGRVDSS